MSVDYESSCLALRRLRTIVNDGRLRGGCMQTIAYKKVRSWECKMQSVLQKQTNPPSSQVLPRAGGTKKEPGFNHREHKEHREKTSMGRRNRIRIVSVV